MPKTRVVVVDDSALVRSLLAEIINRQPDMQCVGAAADRRRVRSDTAVRAAAGAYLAREPGSCCVVLLAPYFFFCACSSS